MEQSTQPHAGTNGGAIAQVHGVTIEDLRRTHPDPADGPPHPQYAGEPDGSHVDPGAFGDDDASGPAAAEPAMPHADEPLGGPPDIDWFAVELVAGRDYVFHVGAKATGGGTLEDAVFGGFWLDPDGGGLEAQEMSGCRQMDGGQGTNTVLTMTAARSGTFYFAALARNRALRPANGSCSVEVFDRTGDAPAGERTDSMPDAAQSTGAARHAAGTERVETGANVDWFRFDVQDGREGMVFQLFLQGAEGFEPTLVVHRLVESGDGTRASVEIAADDNRGCGCLPRLVFIPGEAATYLVEVRDSAAGEIYPGAGTYELHIVDTGVSEYPAGTGSADSLEDDDSPHPMFGHAGDWSHPGLVDGFRLASPVPR